MSGSAVLVQNQECTHDTLSSQMAFSKKSTHYTLELNGVFQKGTYATLELNGFSKKYPWYTRVK